MGEIGFEKERGGTRYLACFRCDGRGKVPTGRFYPTHLGCQACKGTGGPPSIYRSTMPRKAGRA